MARWITILKVPFDYRWPGRTAITAFSATGEFFVKDEIADYAVAKGYALDGKAPAVRARKTAARKPAKKRANAKAANNPRRNPVDRPTVADNDRPPVRPPVDPDAG